MGFTVPILVGFSVLSFYRGRRKCVQNVCVSPTSPPPPSTYIPHTDAFPLIIHKCYYNGIVDIPFGTSSESGCSARSPSVNGSPCAKKMIGCEFRQLPKVKLNDSTNWHTHQHHTV